MATDPSAQAIGVDLGGTKMLVGVVDGAPQVLHRSQAGSLGRTSDELLSTLESELREAREACSQAVSIRLGVPCTIDRERGIAIGSVNLPLLDVPIRDIVSERLGIPVFVDNDANVAALAEHRFGAARGATNAIMLTIVTGIGGGIIIDGEVYRGSTGAAAELGHIVIAEDGPRCQGNCPNHGCVESLASGTALAREGRAAAEASPESALGEALADGQEIDGRLVTVAALEGDATSRGLVADIGRHIGVALSSLANVFEPDVFVIGGGVMAAGELLLEPARDELQARALRPNRETPVVAAELGPDAGMIGAATMAREELAEVGVA